MRRKRLLILVIVIALALPLCRLAYVTPARPSDHQIVILPGGDTVELLGYSFGKKHELRIRDPLKSLRELPDLLRPAPVVRSAVTDRDALLLWVRIPPGLVLHPGYGPPFLGIVEGANGYQYPLDSDARLKYVTGNAYGAMQYVGTGSGQPVLHTEEILAIPLTGYPQRESRFPVDIFQYGGRLPLATFQITNPSTDRPAPFVAERIPASRKLQDLQVTLESITPMLSRQYVLAIGSTAWCREKGEPKDGVLLPGQGSGRKVTLSYAYRGKPDANWKISELEAFDATGNRTEEIAAAPSWPCRSYDPPNSGESYKLRIGVVKTPNSRFEKDELWTVSNIPLPANGKPVAISGEFKRDDLDLQLVSLRGMDGKNFNKDMAVIKIKIGALVANPVLLVHVEDEQGHTLADPQADVNAMYGAGNTAVEVGNLEIYHTGEIGDGDPNYRTVALKIPKGVKHIKLFFKLPRTHFFEFTAPAYRYSADALH